jgi:hypothetical protein
MPARSHSASTRRCSRPRRRVDLTSAEKVLVGRRCRVGSGDPDRGPGFVPLDSDRGPARQAGTGPGLRACDAAALRDGTAQVLRLSPAGRDRAGRQPGLTWRGEALERARQLVGYRAAQDQFPLVKAQDPHRCRQARHGIVAFISVGWSRCTGGGLALAGAVPWAVQLGSQRRCRRHRGVPARRRVPGHGVACTRIARANSCGCRILPESTRKGCVT